MAIFVRKEKSASRLLDVDNIAHKPAIHFVFTWFAFVGKQSLRFADEA